MSTCNGILILPSLQGDAHASVGIVFPNLTNLNRLAEKDKPIVFNDECTKVVEGLT